jgi:conserved oligomeric Golgi complex subunit 6
MDSSSTRQSALSARISTVLSTSYSDLEIRDALAVLDKRNFNNTAEARRQLRLDIQDEVIKANGEVLSDFGGVVEELRRVEAIISRISTTCATLRSYIEEGNKLTAPMREEAGDLLSRRKDTEVKQVLLGAFSSHFVLAESEEAILTSSDNIDNTFFTTLAKLKRIHADSQVLLSSASDRLGLSILDHSSQLLNTAFQKLFRWTQREFRTLDLENPQLSTSMRRALRVLAEKPALFNSSVDNFASTRETTLSNAFHSALTGQGDHTVGKPIEFQAHDPLRYISDMLAWAHSATVGEREALEVLFIGEGEALAKGIQEGIENDPWSRNVPESADAEAFDGKKALDALVSRDIAGVSRLLRQRAEQVIQGQEDAIIAFKIANLLAFYKNTFKKLLGVDSEIMNTLNQLQSSAQRQFRIAMSDSVALMKPDLSVTPTSTAAPDFLKDALETLKNLLKSYDTSVAATGGADDSQFTIQSLLSTALEPFLSGALSITSSLTPPNQQILASNSLLATKSVLSQFRAHTSTAISDIDTQIATHTEKLTEYIHASLLAASGIKSLVDTIVPIPIESIEELRAAPEMQPAELRESGAQLDAWLPAALVDAAEEVEGLDNVRIAREVVEGAAQRFVLEFEDVEERIVAVDELQRREWADEGDNEEEDEERLGVRDLFPRTSAEIKVLLS